MSPRPPPHAPARDVDKREAILDAALDLFVERGFHGTAVPQIAERAGVGAGTIYRYFESKEALVNALYQRWKKSRSRSSSLDDFPVDRAAARAVPHAVDAAWPKFALANPEAFVVPRAAPPRARISTSESRAIEARHARRSASRHRRARRRAASSRPVPPSPHGLVMGAFVGMFRSCVEGRLELDARTIWTLAEQCCWEAIRA